jgi:menaquinone-dependent protoporphyrinogen oxidase
MKKVLVAFATSAGSTREVAQAVAEEIGKSGLQVDLVPVGEVRSLKGYDGVVVGGPMIMGWHRAARGFLKRHRRALREIPLALFATAMSLTETGETSLSGVPLYIDETLPQPPKQKGRLSLRERYATPANYVRPMLSATHPTKPVSIAFFGGRLDYGRLKWWEVLFAMVIIRARAGERRNWPAIRAWAAGLPTALRLLTAGSEGRTQLP